MTDPQVPSGEQPAMPAASEQPTMPVPPPVPPQQDWPQPAAAPPADGPAWGQPQPAPQQSWQQPTPPAGPSWGQPAQPAPQQWSQQAPQPAPQQWPQQAAQPGWGQPGPAQPGWVQPAQVQAPGHSMFRVILSALFLLAIGILTLVPALFFLIGGTMLSSLLSQLGASVQAESGVATTGLKGLGDTLTAIGIVVGIVMLVWALMEVFGSIGMFMRRTWGRVLGTFTGLIGGLFTTLILVGAISGLNATDTGTSSTLPAVVIFAIMVVGYWFTLIACISGGTHFRRG